MFSSVIKKIFKYPSKIILCVELLPQGLSRVNIFYIKTKGVIFMIFSRFMSKFLPFCLKVSIIFFSIKISSHKKFSLQHLHIPRSKRIELFAARSSMKVFQVF